MTQLEYIEKSHDVEIRIQELKKLHLAKMAQEDSRHSDVLHNEQDVWVNNKRKMRASFDEQRALLQEEQHALRMERAKSKAEEEAVKAE